MGFQLLSSKYVKASTIPMNLITRYVISDEDHGRQKRGGGGRPLQWKGLGGTSDVPPDPRIKWPKSLVLYFGGRLATLPTIRPFYSKSRDAIPNEDFYIEYSWSFIAVLPYLLLTYSKSNADRTYSFFRYLLPCRMHTYYCSKGIPITYFLIFFEVVKITRVKFSIAMHTSRFSLAGIPNIRQLVLFSVFLYTIWP